MNQLTDSTLAFLSHNRNRKCRNVFSFSFGFVAAHFVAKIKLFRQLLLLTDGEVTNTNLIIDLVKKNADNTRCDTSIIARGS